MAWSELQHAMNMQVKPRISIGKDLFETLDVQFRCAKALKYKL